jgi:hypothetical protein
MKEWLCLKNIKVTFIFPLLLCWNWNVWNGRKFIFCCVPTMDLVCQWTLYMETYRYCIALILYILHCMIYSKPYFHLEFWIHGLCWSRIYVRISGKRRYSDSLRAKRSAVEFRWEERFPAPVQTGPGAHPASYTMVTGSFTVVKPTGCGVEHPPQTSAEVKENVFPLWAFVACSRVNLTFTFTFISSESWYGGQV